MMGMDQCHSTVGKKPVVKPRAVPMEDVGVSSSGAAYWRDLDEVVDTPQFRDWLEREFPAGASELLSSSRRTFVKLMGASLALAGVASIPGCRRPEGKILPYSKTAPEDVIPGKALYFATSMPLPGGGAEGLLIETHEGRPTKVEGNPTHPANRGKSSAWSQASVLGLYDPDRVKNLTTGDDETPRAWQAFDTWAQGHFKKFDASGGAGLAFIVDKQSSPSRDRMRAAVLKRWPKARWIATYTAECVASMEATRAVFGSPMREVLNLDQAGVVLSLDRDFLGHHESGHLRNARGWAARRKVMKVGDTMSRVYVAESSLTGTGAKADHRLALEPAAIATLAVLVAREVLAKADEYYRGVAPQRTDVHEEYASLRRAAEGVAVPSSVKGVDPAWVKAVAADLWENKDKGGAIVVAGPTMPPQVHALAIALNGAMRTLGTVVQYYPMSEDEATFSCRALSDLAGEMNAGSIDTVVCLNANPVYDAPGGGGGAGAASFPAAFAKVPHRVTLSVPMTETVAASTWRLHGAHFLESWGDTLADDGTSAPVQPMIAPIYGGRSELEVLAVIAGEEVTSGYEIVRQTWRERLGLMNNAAGFEKVWRRALHNGWFAMSAQMRMSLGSGDPGTNVAKLAEMIGNITPPKPAGDKSLAVVFTTGMPGDGRFANCGWLQELPEPTTKVVWDNVAMMSPATIERFGLEREREDVKQRRARMCTITHEGRKVTLPAWGVPGLPDNVVVVSLGYGRRVCGHVGSGVGVDVNPLRDAAGSGVLHGARLERAVEGEPWYFIATTQLHGSMEGRAVVREVDWKVWDKFGDDPLKDLSEEAKEHLLVDAYGNKRVMASGEAGINLGERLGTGGAAGELTHAPSNINIYTNPQRGTKQFGMAEKNEFGKTPDFAKGPQWGMSIDLSTCDGCNVCTIACQSENNIPIVGKIEVDKGRELQWIRVDRYFQGDPAAAMGKAGADVNAGGGVSMSFQPVACVHCENAPCETVCPVNATVHGPEGINYMVYNRCIGTRYCANNCPYKVRRFNFFDYGVKKYNGGYVGRETLEDAGIGGPTNTNLIPPRLRERLDEITKMHMNPDVTVRSRGVMEKCSYCIQRINTARAEVKIKNMPGIPDGFVQAACQQACPTDAISFGDIHDAKSRIYTERNHQRTYALLGFLNTRPRTTYMIGMRNPNPVLVSAERKESWEHPFGHHGDHGEHGHDDHEHGGGHGEEHSMNNFFDPAKAGDDRGYRLSLAVLGGRA